MKPRTGLIVGIVIVLVVLVVYMVVAKPSWGEPSFWLANFVETPRKVYHRSSGTFDEEAALAFDRATSGRNPSPSDHLLAATIITSNILGQEHRPELDTAGRPTTGALERAQLRHEMLGRARDHYMEALQGLNRQMGQAPARDVPGQTPAQAARRARRRVRAARAAPPPPEAGFMVDAALDFAVGGMLNAVQNDPLLAVLLGGGDPFGFQVNGVAVTVGGADAAGWETMLPMPGFLFDAGLAGMAQQTREQLVAQRQGAAVAAAAAAGGAAGARIDAYTGLATHHTDDPENSHDPGVNGCLRGIMQRLRADQEGAELPPLDGIEQDIRRDWLALADGKEAALNDALAVVGRARNGEKSVAIGATDQEVLQRVWLRADDPRNAASQAKLRRAAVDALRDSWKLGMDGSRRVVCVNGRTSRQIGALAMLDHDERNWTVMALEQFKNDVFAKSHAMIGEEARAAAASPDAKLAKVGASYLAKTKEEVLAVGDVDDAAGEAFAESLRGKIDALVDAYVAEVDARAPGAIPPHMIAPLKIEAKAAVV